MTEDRIARMMALDAAQQGGASDYTQLVNKPSVNGVTLSGNKTAADLGIQENVQPDWNQNNTAAEDFIKNKPTIPSPVTVDQTYNAQSANAQSGVAVAQAVSGKISATDYATQTTGGTIKAWTTTDGSDTILYLATE